MCVGRCEVEMFGERSLMASHVVRLGFEPAVTIALIMEPNHE